MILCTLYIEIAYLFAFFLVEKQNFDMISLFTSSLSLNGEPFSALALERLSLSKVYSSHYVFNPLLTNLIN